MAAADPEEVKLIGSKCSFYCKRIEWALKLKGIKYDYIHEDLFNKSEMLLKSNPVHKKVPVLLHGEVVISESLVMLEYLDDKSKDTPLLLPRDLYEKTQARLWVMFADENVVKGVWEACKKEGEGKAALESLSVLEKKIEGNKFFGEDRVRYLDLVVGWLAIWADLMEEVGEMTKLLEAERFLPLYEWSRSFIQIPLVQACLPPKKDLLNFLTATTIYFRSSQAKKP